MISTILFQSLFYWTSFKNYSVNRFLIHHFLCFNPCFIGLHSKTEMRDEGKVFGIMFQSLFYWTSFKNYMEHIRSLFWAKFQSLFYWTSFKNEILRIFRIFFNQFQSLFYWTSFKNYECGGEV